ncbi:papain family cysteine protease, partial [Ostertagia ostertagi]
SEICIFLFSFDSREEWKECPSIRYIRDQSHCGSCWAVSAAATMSDRLCVQTLRRKKTILSDTDILACCGDFCGFGCDAWLYAQKSGVCSGGRYKEQGVCKPYTFHPCGRHKNQTYYGDCPKHTYRTPMCKQFCQYGYGKRYDSDKVYATAAYRIKNDEAAIQAQIIVKGPVQASFATYEDFAYYKSGIYVHTAGKRRGGHAVKIIGWGVENGTKVFGRSVANSWNTDWGEDGGYFRIVRGVDNCGFESGIVAGDFHG